MKIYRVIIAATDGQSIGYRYFSNRSDAEANRNTWRQTANAEIELIDVQSTKSGILEALNKYASHANNG